MADFVYIRLHGGESLYGYEYSRRELRNWSERIRVWLEEDLDVYTYFNNDAFGYAVKNALTLKELLSPGLPSPGREEQ
jgi:uncharacterized protein YecE (DUF72 family)